MATSTQSMPRKFFDVTRLAQPGLLYVAVIFTALIAFEIFNYSTTNHALQDLLGTVAIGGLRWSTILTLAFCGIDFAGIARLFTPQQGAEEPKEVWYLFGAWLLAATMNAVLTWWGVSMAITNHQVTSSAVVDPKTIATVVPVFVAVVVWVIRLLLIGMISNAVDRYLHGARSYRKPLPPVRTMAEPSRPAARSNQLTLTPRPSMARHAAQANKGNAVFAPRAEAQPEPSRPSYPEPTYHNLSLSARGSKPVNMAVPRGKSMS